MFGGKEPARFVRVYSQKVAGKNEILIDTVTGVNYFFHQDDKNAQCGGLTPLLGPDGKPVVTPPELLPK
ncbi:MAG: xylan 1,4-beta-xylosidase [Oscillospiraceae bacterium]|nr:xylan 1,4-beta-xylosidase [Oscillospiraceae bacterium]